MGYYVSRVEPGQQATHLFDARAEVLMDLVSDLRDMLEYPQGHDVLPGADVVSDLPTFDMESWLYLSHPDWKSSGGRARCSPKAIRRYADAMERADSFVGVEYREAWNRWKTAFVNARDHSHEIQLTFD